MVDPTPDDSTSGEDSSTDDSTSGGDSSSDVPVDSAEDDGCGSVISGLPVVLALMLGSVAIVAKKKVRDEE